LKRGFVVNSNHAELSAAEVESLVALAQRGRWHVLKTVAASKAGHVGGPLSAMDLLIYLFFKELNLRPEEPSWPERDRFVLSKGHAAIGLYTAMALRGYFDETELATFDKGDSRLQGHPDSTKLPGIEISTGSLGQGLSFGVGTAIAARELGQKFNSWVMLGDGELQEGMVWESAAVAAKFKLANLTAVVDLNGLGQYGLPQTDPNGTTDRISPWQGFDVAAIFRAFGWAVVELENGHDFASIHRAFGEVRALRAGEKPIAVIAKTVKGKGLSFAEGSHKWHTGIATEDQLNRARIELGLEALESVG
jgi:transketolase